ncbi:hypothetical protein C8Q79DRAFT_1005446 [Trametes meyenii]|nr:hypothetical protein C8Q79DRAFT_1005446 [Trametes meyenii]
MSSERYNPPPAECEQVVYEDPSTPATVPLPCDLPLDYSSGNWALHYSYDEPHYTHYQLSLLQTGAPEAVDARIPLHAPVPVSGYSALLPPYQGDTTGFSYSSFDQADVSEDRKPNIVGQTNPLDVYLEAPQVLFPTPSELLSDLNSRERNARGNESSSNLESSKPAASRSTTGRAKAEPEEPESLNQRKTYFRSISDNVGFGVTDPDTITSHDKKRCYLECLEEYVQWMHEQIRLVGHEPLPLERVSSYRGLKSRSIRTMLVHKQGDIKKLNEQKLQQEQKFMQLQEEFLLQQMAAPL